MPLLYPTLLVVALLRLAELAHARRNTARLLARGGREVGSGHYPLFVLLHAAWLAALALTAQPAPRWPLLLVLFALLQPARGWVVWSLGPYWTTRIVTLDAAPLSRRGPYRWLAHPNYLIVTAEIALLPLAFGAYAVAAVFSLLNALLLGVRMRAESAALAPRRALDGGGGARHNRAGSVRGPIGQRGERTG